MRAWAKREFKEGPGLILHSCSPADFWKLLQLCLGILAVTAALSRGSKWAKMKTIIEYGFVSLKWNSQRKRYYWFNWDWSVLSPIWLSWPHRKVEDWKFWKFHKQQINASHPFTIAFLPCYLNLSIEILENGHIWQPEKQSFLAKILKKYFLHNLSSPRMIQLRLLTSFCSLQVQSFMNHYFKKKKQCSSKII